MPNLNCPKCSFRVQDGYVYQNCLRCGREIKMSIEENGNRHEVAFWVQSKNRWVGTCYYCSDCFNLITEYLSGKGWQISYQQQNT